MTLAVITLNFCDLACTLWALRRGCVELNPLLQSAAVMLWYKGMVVPALALWLDRRGTREARRGLTLCAVVYGSVCVWHAIGLLVLTAR
jgi:hypothetical protein